MHESEKRVEIALEKLVEIAVEHWRLLRWASQNTDDVSSATVRSATRRMDAVLKSLSLQIVDPENQPYDAGLAVEVIHHIPSLHVENIVIETVAPIICGRYREAASTRVFAGSL